MAAGDSTDDLKTTLALARKNPLSFGLCLGKKPETTVLMTHKTKAPSVMGQQARKAGETGKFTFGTMSVNGKILELRCEGDAPSGAGRKTKEYLKSAGFSMRVVLLDMTGNVLEGDDDGDSDGEEPAPGEGQSGPDAEPDPRLAEWEQTSADLAAAIDAATDAGAAALEDLRKELSALDDLANGGEPDKALAGAAGIRQGLEMATEAAQVAAQRAKDDRQRWEDARAKMAPMIEQTLATGAGNARKIEALWAFANSKVEAAEPDYAAAIKTISMLVKLIGEARAAAPAEAPAMAEAGASAASAPAPAAPDAAADPAPAPAGGGGGPAAPTAPGAAPGPEPAAAPGPEAGPAAAAAGPAAAAPASAPEPTAPANLAGTIDERIARAKSRLSAVDTLISTYMALIPGSAETTPAAWTTERTRISDVVTAQETAGATADEAKLNAALQDIVELEKTIRAVTARKKDWKAALELFQLQLVPLDHHAQAGAVPQIKPKIDAIKADLAKAEADAATRDFDKAIKALGPLGTRCDEVLALADGYAEYSTVLAQRTSVVTSFIGAAPTGVAPVDTITTELVTLFNDAQADAAADKFPDAVAKLDRIPPLVDQRTALLKHANDYTAWQNEVLTNQTTIDGFFAGLPATLQTEITTWKAAIAPADVGVTGDYLRSKELMIALAVQSRRIIEDCNLHTAYQAKLTTFQNDLAALEAHPGRAGIEDFILAMRNDLTQANADANTVRFATATALLDRSLPQVPAKTAIADQCEQYTIRRDALRGTIDGLRGRPAADQGLVQADALMASAANQALAKDFATAIATLAQADARAQEAKAAADAQDALGALKDGPTLDALATDFEAAFKVFTDMRAAVVSADSGNAFADLIAKADTPAAEARTEATKSPPDYAAARSALDTAIAALESSLATIHASVPFQRSLADLRQMQNTTLPPKNIDDCIETALDEIETLADEAEDLGAAPGYDFGGGEAKLIAGLEIARRAEKNADLYPGIKADRATTVSNRELITGSSVVAKVFNTLSTLVAGASGAGHMTHTVAVLDKILADIDAALAAGDFETAKSKAATGAAMTAAIQADINTCALFDSRLNSYYTLHLSGLQSEEAKPELENAKALVAEAHAALAAGNYNAGLNTLDMVSWAIQRARAAQTEGAAYTSARTFANAALTPVKALDSPPLADRIAALVTRFDEAEALAAATPPQFVTAARKMSEITPDCVTITALAIAARAYESARLEAEAARTQIEAHAQAEAVRPAIDRLLAKYDSAVAMAAKDDFTTAFSMMQEVKAAAEEAKTAADHAAIFDGIAETIGNMGDDEGPDFGQITAAKTVLQYLQGRDDAVVATADLDIAAERIAFAEVTGNPPAERTQALRDAMDATRRAETVLVQHRELMRSVETARKRIDDSLGSHAQAAYVAADVAKMKSDLDAIVLLVSSGTSFDKATADLNATMERYAEVLADADGQEEFVALRASPDLDDRLDALVAHAHSYAIRASIDTMRSKIEEGDDAAADRDHDAALTALNDAIRIGASALVMADMQANIPPTPDAIKAIMNGPGGLDELDAMIDQLEPDAQYAVIKVAFEARFGCKLENWRGGALVADGGATAPDIVAFYKVMSDLPIDHTLDNDSFRVFRTEETGGGGSRYNGSGKTVIMDEGSNVTSGPRVMGSEHEVGTVEPGCEPANDEPLTMFSWNTLHEVGHAVDDQQGFMNARQSGPSYGGWQVHGRNAQPVAAALAGAYDYDAAYIGQLLAGATPALPDIPDGVDPQEWDSRRIRVEAHIAAARVGMKPWASMAAATRLAIGGRVYQESYPNNWTSYELAARSRGITAYQFRAPGEWFSELYAAYHSGKLKDTHPSASWLAAL